MASLTACRPVVASSRPRADRRSAAVRASAMPPADNSSSRSYGSSGQWPRQPEFGSPTAIPPPAGASTEVMGAKLEKWMKDPLSFLAMGPRAGLGALSIFPELLEKIPAVQAEIEEKINFVVNDPRPIDEKQNVIAMDVESTIADLIGKGVKVETEMLMQLSAQLPAELLEAIPAEVKSAFPGLAGSKASDPFAEDWESPAAEQPYSYSADDATTFNFSSKSSSGSGEP